jgi:porin
MAIALAAAAAITTGMSASVARGQDGYQLADVPIDLPGHVPVPRPKPASQPASEPEPAATPNPLSPTLTDDVPPATEHSDVDLPILERERLTGNWWSVRDSLEARGFDFNASYTFEWSSVFSGGVSRRASSRSLFDANLTLDLAKAINWNGATVFIDFYSTDGRGGSAEVGDFQGFSLIETSENDDQIAELWFEQILFDESLRFKLGKIDAATEFAFINAAGNFSNASSGFSPTIAALPSYPDPAVGGVVQFMPSDTFYVSAGFFDGAGPADGVRTGPRGPETFFSDDESDDWLWIGEVGFGWSFAERREGRGALGVWHHTGDWAEFEGVDPDNPETSTNFGVYALVEQRVHQCDGEADDSEQGVYLFAQLGWADGDVNEAQWHAGMGVSLNGTFDGRDEDSTGVYFSWVGLNDDAGYSEDEIVLETFYKVQVTPWASVKPDLQVIFNPGGTDDYETAVVGTLLFEVVF